MKRFNRGIRYIIILALCASFSCDLTRKKDLQEFRYSKVLQKEYAGMGLGGVIPLTIEQATDIDGDISADGLYFFYSSDREGGNYDIYLRYLRDITTVRITNHPSKDTAPAFSPDGKQLAFVSQREDPEGDIYVVKINPKKLIEQARESVSEIPTLDKTAKNITQFQDPVSRTIKIIKDASPCWSPDGKWIAFSSTRDGNENIWVCNRDGQQLTKITSKGGMYPRFSSDGKQIIYISYQDSPNGEVYTLNFNAGTGSGSAVKRITNDNGIKLYPSFMSTNAEIVYTLINRDVNSDGKIDIRDNSIIYYKNLKSGLGYPLTRYSTNSFGSKWFSNFVTDDLFKQDEQSIARAIREKGYRGIVLFCDQIGQNINVNIIPEYGIIRKRMESAKYQYQLAGTFTRDFDDPERYVMGLERVYYFYGDRNDPASIVYTAKALTDAVLFCIGKGNIGEARRLQALLGSLSKDALDYRSIMARYLQNVLSDESGLAVLEKALLQLKADAKRSAFVPYLMEDYADALQRAGKSGQALALYKKIVKEFDKYERLLNVNARIGGLVYTEATDAFPEAYIRVFSGADFAIKEEASFKIINLLESERDPKVRLASMQPVYAKNKDDKKLSVLNGLALYIIGKSQYDAKDAAKAKETLQSALKLVTTTTLVYYKASILLGEIGEKENRPHDAEKFFAQAAINYQLWMNQANYRSVVMKLLEYYEDYGDRAEQNENFKDAVDLYKKYITLLKTVRRLKRYDDIYNEYGARVHVLLVDAFSRWKGDTADGLEKLKNEVYFGPNNGNLNIAILDFDKAHIYGLGYLYAKMAVILDKKDTGGIKKIGAITGGNLDEVLGAFKKGIAQLEWALFIDDTFVDPYILKGWIYQYVDLMRDIQYRETGRRENKAIDKFFPRQLWESNIELYEKALAANDEKVKPEYEGNLHLNMANTYFLLQNYPRALTHYLEAKKYKKKFNSRVEEAMFYFHTAYCFWQNDNLDRARREIRKTLNIYMQLAEGNKIRQYKHQIYSLYRYYALFDRIEGNYQKAIGWYNQILEFAGVNKIDIDQARYMQEIAHCYKELGDSQSAITYLERADKLLKKYPDEERKYRMWARLLFIPIPWNLGPDNAVVGDNKIFYELDTYNKKLLNISLRIEIYFNNGDYLKTIELYKYKIRLLEKRSYNANKEGIARTLNNIGYCYYKMRNFSEAQNYFNRAWEYVLKENSSDLEGIRKTIINLSNLLVFFLENDIRLTDDAVQSISKKIREITDFRDSYESKKYEIEYAKLEQEAKSKKVEVADKDADQLKAQIAADAQAIYYSLDIAIGVLNFYKGETRYKKEIELTGAAPGSSFALYKANRDLFDLYAEAKKRFTNVLAKAETGPKRLYIKLLLNLGSCQKRMGDVDEARDSLVKAENTAREFGLSDLLWEIYFIRAGFVREYGRETEGAGYLGISDGYYTKAIGIVEKEPYLYGEKMYRIKNLYQDYITSLAGQKQWGRVLDMAERQYQCMRSILVLESAPEFVDQNSRELYYGIVHGANRMQAARDKITSLISAAEPKESEKFKAERAVIAKAEREIAGYKQQLARRSPLVLSYVSVGPLKLSPRADISTFTFLNIRGRVYALAARAGKISATDCGESADPTKDHSLISNYLAAVKEKSAINFIVLNDYILEIVKKKGARLPIAYMLTPSMDRIPYFLASANNGLKNIYFSGQGVKGLLDKDPIFKDAMIEEKKAGTVDFSDFSIIVDNQAEAEAITPSYLFSHRCEPTLLIKQVSQGYADTVSLLVESALYSGIRSMIITTDSNPAGYQKIMQGVYAGSLDKAMASLDEKTDRLFMIGFKGTERDARAVVVTKNVGELFNRYTAAIKAADYIQAAVYLNRWHELTGSDANRRLQFFLRSAALSMLMGNNDVAIEKADRALADKKALTANQNARAMTIKTYCLLARGDMAAATELLKRYADNPVLQKSGDFTVYSAITGMAANGVSKAATVFSSAAGKRTFLPINRLRLLYAEYAVLFGGRGDGKRALAEWSHNYSINDREALTIIGLDSRKTVRYTTKRAQSISKVKGLRPINAIKQVVQLSIEDKGRYDVFSPILVAMALDRYIAQNRFDEASLLIGQLDIRSLAACSDWRNVLPLFSKMSAIHGALKNYEAALAVQDAYIRILDQKKLSALKKVALFEKALTLMKYGISIPDSKEERGRKAMRYNESYALAQAGAALASESDDLYAKYQLLLIENEVATGDSKKIVSAKERIAKISPRLRKEYIYVLNLLQALIPLGNVQVKVEAKADIKLIIPDLIEFERQVVAAIDSVDRSSESLSRYNRIDLFKLCLDSLAYLKFKAGRVYESIVYTEIGKQLQVRERFYNMIAFDAVPDSERAAFKRLRDAKKDQDLFVDMMKKYPSLYASTAVTSLALGNFQKSIPADAVVIYLGSYGPDIIGILIDSARITALPWMNKGAVKVREIMIDYKNACTQLSSTVQISKRLQSVFAPVMGAIAKKKTVYFVTDNELESVPFDIIGAKELLYETHTVVQLSSITANARRYRTAMDGISVYRGTEKSIAGDLELLALREAGIAYQISDAVKKGIAHLQGLVLYNPMSKVLYLNERKYDSRVKSAGMVYVTAADFSEKVSYNEFALLNALSGTGAVIVNDAAIRDVNNALFVDKLFSGMRDGKGVIGSFARAKKAISRDNRYKHPAYWAGIRLYVNKI